VSEPVTEYVSDVAVGDWEGVPEPDADGDELDETDSSDDPSSESESESKSRSEARCGGAASLVEE
jgi:hypothetical protein